MPNWIGTFLIFMFNNWSVQYVFMKAFCHNLYAVMSTCICILEIKYQFRIKILYDAILKWYIWRYLCLRSSLLLTKIPFLIFQLITNANLQNHTFIHIRTFSKKFNMKKEIELYWFSVIFFSLALWLTWIKFEKNFSCINHWNNRIFSMLIHHLCCTRCKSKR